jgi:predicted nucleic acid-binding protein
VIAPAPPDIHLDSSFLIRALVAGSPESSVLDAWLGAGRVVSISTLAWGEFLCGHLSEEDEELAARVTRKHVPLRTEEAVEAARLFNATGRRRSSFQDCIVAASAIRAGAALATTDRDFDRFVPAGLKLAE